MSRFSDEYDDWPEYPNAGDLWWSSITRALNGKRGQAALAELEQALLGLPEPQLIGGHLGFTEGGVCAVGALVTRRRLSNGEKLDAILADLERRTPPECEDGPDDETPEQRYERVLAWVREAQIAKAAA